MNSHLSSLFFLFFRRCFFCLSLLTIFASFLPSTESDLRAEEYSALEVFYQDLNGPSWLVLPSDIAWNFGDDAEASDPCDGWMGITCNNENTSLVMLALPSRQLSGELATDSFQEFIALRVLILTNNSIYGDFPTSAIQSQNISMIMLDQNHFSGTIALSSSVMSVLSMRALNLSYNNFEGDISFVYQMPSLEVLVLDENRFTGSIHPSISGLQHLRLFTSMENPLSGTIPTAIAELSELEGLNLASCGLSGTVPTEISGLTKLRYFRLDFNYLSGSLEGVFSPAQTGLELVDLSNNAFTGNLPSQLFQLPPIRILSLLKNSFHGSIPNTICGLNNLELLSLSGLTAAESTLIPRYMDGGIPGCVFNMTNLRVFHAAGNGFRGTINSLHPDSKLQDLSISHNIFTGYVPQSIQSQNFTTLDISYNKFHGTFQPNGHDHSSDSIYINFNR